MKTFYKKTAFTLVEVILAVGIFAIAVVALIGLFGSAVTSVDSVESHDEVILATNRLDETINSLSFDEVYSLAVNGATDNSALFFYNTESNGTIFPTGPFEINRNGEIDFANRIRRSDVTSAIQNGEIIDDSIVVVEIPPITDTSNRPIEVSRNVRYPNNPDGYEEAYVPFFAKFYLVPISQFLSASQDLTPEDTEILIYPLAKLR